MHQISAIALAEASLAVQFSKEAAGPLGTWAPGESMGGPGPMATKRPGPSIPPPAQSAMKSPGPAGGAMPQLQSPGAQAALAAALPGKAPAPPASQASMGGGMGLPPSAPTTSGPAGSPPQRLAGSFDSPGSPSMPEFGGEPELPGAGPMRAVVTQGGQSPSLPPGPKQIDRMIPATPPGSLAAFDAALPKAPPATPDVATRQPASPAGPYEGLSPDEAAFVESQGALPEPPPAPPIAAGRMVAMPKAPAAPPEIAGTQAQMPPGKFQHIIDTAQKALPGLQSRLAQAQASGNQRLVSQLQRRIEVAQNQITDLSQRQDFSQKDYEKWLPTRGIQNPEQAAAKLFKPEGALTRYQNAANAWAAKQQPDSAASRTAGIPTANPLGA